jgi:hypothetical protein
MRIQKNTLLHDVYPQKIKNIFRALKGNSMRTLKKEINPKESERIR